MLNVGSVSRKDWSRMNESEEQNNIQRFVDALCQLIIVAHKQWDVPIEVIYLNLQCHSHDIMTHIVQHSPQFINQSIPAANGGH